MIDIKNINNNLIANCWKERYANLPNHIKEKLNKLDNAKIEEYQLQVIKKKRLYPQIGDVFQINPRNNILLYGVVINHRINNINGEDLLLVFIFKEKVNLEEVFCKGIEREDLLIPPQIVGKEYWTRGYFYNVDSIDIVSNVKNYGFYSIGKRLFLDEYGQELANEPELLGTYGVATISGIARKINQELIIAGVL